MRRNRAVLLIAGCIFFISAVVILNFDTLFELVVSFTTKYSQPFLGFLLCLFAGWVWKRNEILKELQSGSENAEHSLFWKIWPWYIRFVCPVMIVLVITYKLLPQ